MRFWQRQIERFAKLNEWVLKGLFLFSYAIVMHLLQDRREGIRQDVLFVFVRNARLRGISCAL